MSRLQAVLLPVLVCGCFVWGGGNPTLEPVDDAHVLEFAERISAFYGALEDIPLDAFVTFEDPELRAYFRGDREFTDYYASLASQVRQAHFRHSRATRVLVDDFTFAGEEIAQVQLTIVGQHERILRFWKIQLQRTDTWLHVDGTWYLTPDKL